MKAIYIDHHRTGAVDAAHRPVRAVMSTPVTCVGQAMTHSRALQTMAGQGLRHLVVVDEAGRCQGILSDRAVAAAWASDFGCLPHVPVAAVLDPQPACVSADARVLDAARTMREAGTDAVAVLDPDGAVLGIVTGSDLIALLAGVAHVAPGTTLDS